MMSLRTARNGTINVCVLVLPGAEVGRIPWDYPMELPYRVKRDIDAANHIWKQRINGRIQGVKFNVIDSIVFNNILPGISGDAQHFPWNQEQIGQILLGYGRRFSPNAHVFIFYMNGNSIGPIHANGSQTDAITFRDLPVIIMSNGAQSRKYILAHELGHFMYLNNILGNTSDPNPYPQDPDHNENPSNLMYPRSDFWPESPLHPTITPNQIWKALKTRFFYDQ